MGRRIVGLILLVALAVFGVYLYQRYKVNKELASGETHCVGCMTPEEKARFDRQNSGDEPVAPGDHTQDKSSAAALGAPPAVTDQVAPPVRKVVMPGTQAEAPVSYPASDAARVEYPAAAGATNPPAGDTVAPNPPNGMVFAGRGTYQWYRQGNLTWRVDTTSGRSCIVYATMEEWRKQIVATHGCGRDA